MNIQPLPSIRVYDQGNSGDNDSDRFPSTNPLRAMPLDIPMPKYGSPTASRCGSVRSSMTSGPIAPPILSLDPPGPPLPPMNYPHHRDVHSAPGSMEDLTETDGIRPRSMVETGGRDAGRHWLPTPMGSRGADDEFSLRSDESSYDRRWREGFYQNHEREGSLHNQEAQRAQTESVKAYDNRQVAKLNLAKSDPATLSRGRNTPPRDFRPSSGGSEKTDPPFPPSWPMRKGSPRNLPSSDAPSPLEAPPAAAGCARTNSRSLGLGTQDNVSPHLTRALIDRPGPDSLNTSSLYRLIDHNISASDPDSRLRRSISASHIPPGHEDRRNTRGSCDSGDEDLQMEDVPSSHVSKMQHLSIHTPPLSSTPPRRLDERTGSKRRASSPPSEDRMSGVSEPTRKGLMTESVGNDIYGTSRGRRPTPPVHHPLRTSPKHHYPQLPRSAAGSFTSASVSSGTTMWQNSLCSATSSVTTVDRSSPAASFTPAPAIERGELALKRHLPHTPARHIPVEQQYKPPYPHSVDQNVLPPISTELPAYSSSYPKNPEHSVLNRRLPLGELPRGDLSRGGQPQKLTGMGIFICDCCPKKPKKFDNAHDLAQHANEKQFSCNYCNNRFKNKNEAERHQNSLHLRKHSWSCAALPTYSAAFHPDPAKPDAADLCGYCGISFPKQPTADWNARVEHLTTEHKWGECNKEKKFYRADHFRQHLKHSHSGTSGKWTNVLENACMRDEPTPVVIGNRGGRNSGAVASEDAMSE